jgi:hypothetical protein
MLEIPRKKTGIAIIESGCENVNQIQNVPVNQDNTGRKKSSFGNLRSATIYPTPRKNVGIHQKPIWLTWRCISSDIKLKNNITEQTIRPAAEGNSTLLVSCGSRFLITVFIIYLV